MSNNQPPIPPLDKCAECQKSFSQGQEYWELKREGITVMNSCVPCWDKHTFAEKEVRVKLGKIKLYAKVY